MAKVSVAKPNSSSFPTFSVMSLIERNKVDIVNIAVLLTGFVVFLLLVSPSRIYPMDDDWAYIQSVRDLLNLSYKPHDWTQPSSLGALIFGAVASLIFGYNFSVLTLVTLVMSATCLITFYLLLRHLDITAPYAVLAVAVLGFNPIYVYLSYSFMTDVTFMTYLLMACLFYVRGVQGYGYQWLWLGSAAASLSYLTRQIGFFVAIAALIYLAWSHSLTLKKAIAVFAIPALSACIFMIWEQAQPPHLVEIYLDRFKSLMMANPWSYALFHMESVTWMVLGPGLFLLPLLRLPRRPLRALLIFLPLVGLIFGNLYIYTAVIPNFGNIFSDIGFMLPLYNASVLWPQWVSVLIGIAGALVLSFYLVSCLEGSLSWLRSRPWQRRVSDPAIILYLTAFLLSIVVFVVSPFSFDRYVLPMVPMLLLIPLRHLSKQTHNPRYSIVMRWLLLLPIALFSVIGLNDYKEHAEARWQAAESLVAQGVPPSQVAAGFEWYGWYLFQDGVRHIRETADYKWIEYPFLAVLDSKFIVSDVPSHQGYSVISSVSYHTWLNAGQAKQVFILKRLDYAVDK